MNKKIFIGLFCIGMTTLSACVTATSVDTSNPTFNIADANKINENRETYVKCLILGAIKQLDENSRSKISEAPIKDGCALLGREYFNSVYALSYQKEQNAEFSKNTAVSAVSQLEAMTFQKIREQ